MSCSRPYMACSVVVIIAVCAPPALATSPDGIELALTETLPSITLQWTGGSPPYHVYRSTVATTATDIPKLFMAAASAGTSLACCRHPDASRTKTYAAPELIPASSL